jgi:hypothetical protein
MYGRRFVPTAIALLLVAAAVILLLRANKGQSVPFAEIITTGSQEKMRYFDDVVPIADQESYQRKFAGSRTNALSIFLVEAGDERGAISASSRFLFGPLASEAAARGIISDGKNGNHWLVAYLGAGPSYPNWFVIEEPTVKSDKITLTYRTAEAAETTANVQHYYYWIPLGKLKSGTYRLELYDADQSKVTHSRRVDVREQEEMGVVK